MIPKYKTKQVEETLMRKLSKLDANATKPMQLNYDTFETAIKNTIRMLGITKKKITTDDKPGESTKKWYTENISTKKVKNTMRGDCRTF